MDFRRELLKVYRSKTARMLAGSVALILFTSQWVVFLSGLYSDYHSDIAQLVSVEKVKVTEQIRLLEPHFENLPDKVLDDSLVGLIVISGADDLLLQAGETLGFSNIQQQVVANNFVSNHQWLIQTPGETFTVIAYIDTKPKILSTLISALQLFVFAVLSSFIAAAVALMGAFRFYVYPMERLIEALRTSREESKGRAPELIDIPERADLKPLAQEINNLIDGQRKSERQVKVKQQYLEFAAHHDPLTHLPNRLMFEDALKKTVHTSIADNREFSVFLIDLDNFKYFNDQYGNLIGDKMVIEVSNRLRTQISDVDLIARLDGDEFVVLQQDVSDIDSIEKVAERIMRVVTEPYEYRGFTLKVAVSVGISRFPGDVLVSQEEELLGEEIVNNASVALQEAKSLGRAQYQMFTEKMRSTLTKRIRLEEDLKIALEQGQFEVYYQPKINILTKEAMGAEALVRWNHPEHGYVSPEDFVPVAEETGMIIELGQWILRSACFKMRELQKLGYLGLNVAVNISAVQFTDGNLLPMVRKALDDSQLPPHLLELEITESAVMHDPAEVVHSLHQLGAHGMKLAIDDFGTGYSSLAYLKKFPVDTLKIDKAFITDVSSDNDDVAIVEAVIGLGKHFNMKVVAEGIEDEAQLDFLKASGCDVAQGYFVSKPLNSEQYTEWLKRWPYGVQDAAANDPQCLATHAKTGTNG